MKTRTDIINLIFDRYNFKTYLEIGLRDPSSNFNKINAVIKESVDPNPRGNCTYIMTSDDFFKNHISFKKDVIFIDGLHTAEQSYKDIKNSIKNINEYGFIVLHDCNPSEKYHARPFEELSNKINNCNIWNGEVYKSFIKIKQELKEYSCFVVDEDHGCGIITKRKILENMQFDYIDNIEWEYFNKNRNNLLQLISFDEYEKILK